jgi:hypothetical protein
MRFRLILASLAIACVVAPATASAAKVPPPVPTGRALQALALNDHALLALKPDPAAEELVAAAGARLVAPSLGLWQVSGEEATRLIPLLNEKGLLRYAEPDQRRVVQGHLDLGDPLLAQAWHLERIGATAAEPPGPGVPITIVDTGLDVASPDFAGRPDVQLLNTQSPAAYGDALYHGTVVATTAAAAANGLGTVGVNPFAALRVYDLPSLEDSAIIAALDRVAASGPNVINLSLGGPGYSRALYEAVMRAVQRGALVVAAAGNAYGQGNPEIYPADFPHVLTVGATDQSDQPAAFSSSSPAVDLSAPGVGLPLSDPANPQNFSLFDGTSFAAPQVAAAASWVWTARPELDAAQLFELLRGSARDVGARGVDPRTGYGLLDLPAALSAPTPLADPGEPNDDIALVTRGRISPTNAPSLTQGRRSAELRARLDAVEDPHDVYRISVAPGRTLEATVSPDAAIAAALWHVRTKSVLAGGAAARKNRLLSTDRPGAQTERLVYRNTTGRTLTLFLDLSIPGGRGGDSTEYRLRVGTR